MLKDLQVKDAYQKAFGGKYRFFSAPGRINIIGEHTDYNDGFVLPAAIDKRMYLAIEAIEGKQVWIHSVDYKQSVHFDLAEEDADLPQWARYPFGVVRVLQQNGHTPGAFRAVFGADIPQGAGLSSSAALESVFALALNTIFDLGLDHTRLALTGQKAEHDYAGVECGIMDQFASLYGKAGHVIKIDCRTLDFEYYPFDPQDHIIILADTQVKHSLASSEYNKRKHACQEGLTLLRSKMPQLKSLRDLSQKDVAASKGLLGKETFLRCEYVTEENQRVLDACQALNNADLKKLGVLMFQSHIGLRYKYQVSCDELDLLVETAKNIDGVAGARMMGGGFGGCTINLIHTQTTAAFVKASTIAYKQRFGIEPLFYHINIGDGACEH